MAEFVRRRNSIVTRLTLMVAAILAATVLVVGGLAVLEQRRQLGQALETKALTLAHFMAQVSPLKILSLNFVEMQNEVRKVVSTDEEAVCAVILNSNGIPLAVAFKDSDALVTPRMRALAQQKRPLEAIELMKKSGQFLTVTVPVEAGEKNIGSVTVGFSHSKMHRALLFQFLLIGSVLVGIIAVSSALLRLALLRTLRPVKRLTEAATQISTGELEVVVAGTERTDELGLLSRAFESMAKQLREVIAGLKQRESDLRQLTLLQRTILDNAAYGIISASPQGIVTSFNPAAERLLGHPAQEILGKRLPASWYDGPQAAPSPGSHLAGSIPPGVEVFAAHADRQLPLEKEWTFLRQDGTPVPVLLSMTALRDEAGRITGFVGMTYDLTARKKDEAELRKSAEEIHDLYHHAPCGYHSLDKDGVFVRINDTELSWLGYTREELQGKLKFSDLLAPESLKRFHEEFESYKKRGWVSGASFDLIRKDGRVLSIILNSTAIRDPQGNFLMSRSVVTDITALRMAQRAAAEEQERLKFIFDSLEMGVCLHRVRPGWSPTLRNDSGQFLRKDWSSYRIINDAHLRIAGITREEDQLETWRRITHPEDRERQLALTREVEQGKRTHFSMDKRYLRPDGKVVWVIFSLQRRLLEGGGFEDLTSAVDITERKLAEEALRASEEKYRALIQKIQAAVVVYGPDNRIVTCNSLAESLLGVPQQELIGKTPAQPHREFTREDGSEMPPEEYPANQVATRRQPVRNQVVGVHRPNDSREVWVMANADPIFDKDGHIVETIVTFVDITERKKTEQQVALLSFALNHVKEAAYLIDEHDRFLYVNDESCRVLGYQPSELLGKGVPDINPDFAPEQWPAHWNDLKTHRSLSFEGRHRTKEGQVFPVEVSANYIEFGGNAYNLAMVRDITERKRAEQALWESSQMLRLVLENMPAYVFWKDRNSVYLGCNRLFASNAGLSSPEKIAGLTDLDLPWKPEEAQSYRNDDRMVMETGAPKINYEETQHTADGRDTWVRTSKIPLKDPAGSVIGVLGTFEDISERRLAEEALRESEASLRTLTESMPQLVWICRPDGWNIYFNQRWVEYTGLTLEESHGHGWNKPFHPEDQQRARDAWSNAVQTGGRYDLECRLRQADGNYHWFLIRALPLRNAAGEIVKWFGTCTNIDEQKQAQEEVRKLNAELDHRVQERTAMLEAANKELEAFSYSVSHDLRAPLRSIDGFSKALLEDYSDKVDQEGREYLEIVRAASQRMGQLIEDILQLSRISRSELRRSLVDLSAMASAVAEMLQMEDPKRKVNFVIHPNCMGYADGNLVRIVLENLIGNAWKFTGKTPEPRIEFGTIKAEDGDPAFYVRDNGAGFDPQYAERLFGAFQRLHTTTEFPGTGVGLASVKRIIHRHGGKVWIEGKVGEGATAYFTLPRTAET